MKRHALIATLSLAASSATFAASCNNTALPETPSVPAASERNMNSMLNAQKEIKLYIDANKDYLKCVTSARQHNAIVDHIYAVADDYNVALREFRAAQN